MGRGGEVLADLKVAVRYLGALTRYLRRTMKPEDAPRLLERRLASREETFLRVMERGVFAQPRSVYRKLLQHAGIEQGDLEGLVRTEGLEPALARLHRENVYVTLDEFKGRRPIVRSGLEIATAEADFDNPLLAKHYEARSGGSGGVGRRIVVDLDLLAHEAAYHWVFLATWGLTERPLAAWQTVPPATAGIKFALYEAKLGRSLRRWFTQVETKLTLDSPKFFLFTRCTTGVSRLWRRPVPRPEYAPADDPGPVVRWLAECTAAGTPAVMSTYPSCAVRACSRASEDGLDISGTVFLLGGEPNTPGKTRVIAESGSRVVPLYAMVELGVLGIGCPSARSLDEVHLFSEKLAIVQTEKPLRNGASIGTFLFTSLLPSSPKLMLNVDSGDYGLLEDRPCDCAFGELGFTRRLSGIRSYEKLTSEATTFLGSDLITLLEETLPLRFGGGPTDYQLVEHEENGLSKVSVVVSPRLGEIDERALVKTVLEALHADPDKRLMARVWSEARTLKVVRREPYTTPTSKIQPLHMLRG